MISNLFGRNALSKDEIASALVGIDQDILAQLVTADLSPELNGASLGVFKGGYVHGYVFGAGAQVAEDACELFNVKKRNRDEQRNIVILRLFQKVFGEEEAINALRISALFAQQKSGAFQEGLEDGRTEIQHVRRNGEFICLLAMRIVGGDST